MNLMLLLSQAALLLASASAFSLSSKPVSELLGSHASQIAILQKAASSKGVDLSQEPYSNDVFFLRYCLQDGEDALAKLGETLDWRLGEGKDICQSAQSAIAAATSEGKWNNEPVMTSAPHADKILKYLTPSNILTTTTAQNDLVTCIRAGDINDVDLMDSATVDELVDFFVYAREVNACVANTKSLDSDHLVGLLLCNNLEGVKLVGGDSRFRSALSASSKKADPLYPCLNGPTLLLNLPLLFSALVKLFTPLFPPAVKERLRFEQGLLKGIEDLMDLSYGGPSRGAFLKDLDAAVYTK